MRKLGRSLLLACLLGHPALASNPSSNGRGDWPTLKPGIHRLPVPAAPPRIDSTSCPERTLEVIRTAPKEELDPYARPYPETIIPLADILWTPQSNVFHVGATNVNVSSQIVSKISKDGSYVGLVETDEQLTRARERFRGRGYTAFRKMDHLTRGFPETKKIWPETVSPNLLLASLPYMPAEESTRSILESQTRPFAFAGEDGTEFIRRAIQYASLNKFPRLGLEIGSASLPNGVFESLEKNGYHIYALVLTGIPFDKVPFTPYTQGCLRIENLRRGWVWRLGNIKDSPPVGHIRIGIAAYKEIEIEQSRPRIMPLTPISKEAFNQIVLRAARSETTDLELVEQSRYPIFINTVLPPEE